MTLYLGLMSGTSLDGVDAVLVDFAVSPANIATLASPNPSSPGIGGLKVVAHGFVPFAAELHDELLALNASGPDELHRAALAANALVGVYALAAQAVLQDASVASSDVRAIGAHGQTVRHRPGEFDGIGYTLQLNNGALLAELTGIDVVCDFRSRDVAAGGQGAPLVPAFHAAVFGRGDTPVAVLNLGGISNLSLIATDGVVRGFDCGPANALLDGWCHRHTGAAHDDRGRWAAGGSVLPSLLGALLAEPYLKRLPPKSTGRDLFNLAWLNPFCLRHAASASPQDVQATLAEFSAHAVAGDLRQHASGTTELLVCGGGAFNADLLDRISRLSPRVRVRTTESRGLPPMEVEATAFAWLAKAFIERQPGNRVEVTGARGPRVLGALYPAG